ncbi:MAG: hypothetical protein Q4C05_05920 [Akkermansia sp.]|nr:hypothetical protein [Akkermansia sp.]
MLAQVGLRGVKSDATNSVIMYQPRTNVEKTGWTPNITLQLRLSRNPPQPRFPFLLWQVWLHVTVNNSIFQFVNKIHYLLKG